MPKYIFKYILDLLYEWKSLVVNKLSTTTINNLYYSISKTVNKITVVTLKIKNYISNLPETLHYGLFGWNLVSKNINVIRLLTTIKTIEARVHKNTCK